MNLTLDTSKYEYLAGFIDGDGSISIVSEKQVTPYYCPKVAVYNTDFRIVENLRKEFGGNIIIKSPKKSGHKIPYEWRLKGKSAFELLEKCHNFLVIKKSQANLCLALYDIRRHFSRKRCDRKILLSQFEKLKTECAKLNVRGTNKEIVASPVKDIDFKYLAGIIESDGAIFITHIRSKYYRAIVSVSSGDAGLVSSIKKKYSGSTAKAEDARVGNNTNYRWTISGKNAENILKKIFPYLQIKTKQARLLLKLLKLQSKYNCGMRRWDKQLDARCHRVYNKLYTRCAKLNKRGNLYLKD